MLTGLSFQIHDVSATDMAKVKTGFCVRLINRELVVDTLLSDELSDHNQAVLEFLLSIQEDADKQLDASKCIVRASLFCYWLKSLLANSNSPAGQPSVNVRPFLKIEDGNPFYVLPVVSAPLFPQFKGVRPLGVTRAKQQKGS